MPPKTTIRTILKVSRNLNIKGSIVPIKCPNKAPPTPAINDPITKPITLCLNTLIPIASAAISSSLTALNAFP